MLLGKSREPSPVKARMQTTVTHKNGRLRIESARSPQEAGPASEATSRRTFWGGPRPPAAESFYWS